MVALDIESAEARIKAIKTFLEEGGMDAQSRAEYSERLTKAHEVAKELTRMEVDMEAARARKEAASLPPSEKDQPDQQTTEEQAEERRQQILEKDPTAKRIAAMPHKKAVREFMMIEFGEEIDTEPKLDELKAMALDRYSKRLFEAEGL